MGKNTDVEYEDKEKRDWELGLDNGRLKPCKNE